MAEAGSGDKTEKASEHKLRKARRQGQAARSRDLGTAVGVVLGFKLMLLWAPAWSEDLRRLFQLTLQPWAAGDAMQLWGEMGHRTLWLLAKMVAPLALLPLAIAAGSLLAGGWVFAASSWLPKGSRLNPVANLGRVFSARHAGDFGMTLLKVAALGSALVWLARHGHARYVQLQALTLDQAVPAAASLVLDALLTLGALLALFALIDVPLQRLLFLRGQRMSKQELKEEHKHNEGRPEVRQRIRQLQQQIARRSLRRAVPEADVLVVNPEHYAVALRYDARRAEAPFVTAKGVDEMALYMRRLAGEHRVTVLTLPPLARALYNSTQVQQQIPASLYQAVAQVLSYVLQLEAFRQGRRAAEPRLDAELPVPTHLSDPPTR